MAITSPLAAMTARYGGVRLNGLMNRDVSLLMNNLLKEGIM